METAREQSGARYPIPDGRYNQSDKLWYTAHNGVIHLVEGNARFSVSSPTTTYNVQCMNVESWIIPAKTPIKIEIDNLAGINWYLRTIKNSNIAIQIGTEFKLQDHAKNLFGMGTATEGDVTIRMYVNGERWI